MKKIKTGLYETRLLNGVTILVMRDKHGSKWFFRAVDTDSKYFIYESEYKYETKAICLYDARNFVEKCYGLKL